MLSKLGAGMQPAASECLDENQTIEYLSGHLADRAHSSVEGHLADCASCRLLVANVAPSLQRPPVRSFLGRYELLDQAGMGGMGIVYVARDPQLRRRVAIKTLRAADGDASALVREAQALAKLAHPNIIGVFDVGQEGSEAFVAMEFVTGSTLADYFRGGDIPWREAVRIYLQVGRGLAAAHDVGIVHGDFKPSNAMIDSDGRVRVMDFGLARMSCDRHPDNRKKLAGTPAYMSPEQRLGAAADGHSDQYSFCVALYEALCGQRPSIEAAPSGSRPGRRRVSTRVLRVVNRGLNVDARDRYPSMAALLADLNKAIRRRGSHLLVAATIFAIATTVTLVHVSPAPHASSAVCQSAGAAFAASWTTERQQMIENTFVGMNTAKARETWAANRRRIEHFGRQWATAYDQACTRARIEKAESARLYALRVACFEDQLSQLRGLAAELSRADKLALQYVSEAVSMLGSPTQCAANARELLHRPPPPSAHLGVAVRRLEDRIEAIRAMIPLGRPKQALTAIAAVVHDARRVGYKPTLAHALYVGHLAALEVEEFDRAQEFASAAVLAAEAGGDDHRKLEISISMFGAAVTSSQSTELSAAATRALSRARAILDRVDGYPLLDSELHAELGLSHYRHGRPVQALGDFEYALALRKQDPHANPLNLARMHYFVAMGQAALARDLEAISHFQRALDVLDSNHIEGPISSAILSNLARSQMATRQIELAIATAQRAHELSTAYPQVPGFVADSHSSLAELLEAAGRYGEAERQARRAVSLAQGLEFDNSASWRLQVLASIVHHTGRYREAEAFYQRAVDVTEASPGTNHPDYGTALVGRAGNLAQLGRLRHAVRLFSRALEVLEGQPEPYEWAIAHTNAEWAWALLDARRCRDALPHIGRAHDYYDNNKESDGYAGIVALSGLCATQLGQRQRAIMLLRRALGLRDNFTTGDNRDRAEMRFALVTLIADQDANHSVQLARQAETDYAAFLAEYDDIHARASVRKVRRWLRSRQARL